MNKEISILGCGWLGIPLGESLLKSGYSIKGSTTKTEKIELLNAKQIKPYIIDLRKRENKLSAFLESDVLVIAITSKSINDFNYLIDNIEKSKVKNVLFVSSTSVYPNTNGEVNEETPTNGSAIAQIEKLFSSNKNFETTIIRFAGLFGYNRKPGNFIKTEKPIANPEGYVNLIHQDDCVKVIEEVIKQSYWSETFNACSSSHPKRRDYYTVQRKKVGRKAPTFDELSSNEYKIVSNKKLTKALNYNFIHDII